MKKTFLQIACSLLFIHITNAQYLVSASLLGTKSQSQIQFVLNAYGWSTSNMNINSINAYKITYNTTDIYGAPTVASGAVYVPQINCDSLPMVAYLHGTEFKKNNVPSTFNYQGQALLFSANGYITVLPDYLGLGDNSGIHPYLHWESEATATIDLIRAVREFLTDSLQKYDNNELFIAGYSQGGHSAMAVHKYVSLNNLQQEFNVIVSAPMSGPYSLSYAQYNLIFDGDSTFYHPEFLPYVLASYKMVYNNLYTNYSEYYDAPYDSLINAYFTNGTYSNTAWNNMLPNNYYYFVQDSVLNNLQSNPNHSIMNDLRLNDLHNWIPAQPVRMLYCGMDSMVSPLNSILAADTMIALGSNTTSAVEITSNGTHETCFTPAMRYALSWFDSLATKCQSTSINTLNNSEHAIYPNPTTGKINFQSYNDLQSIEIIDISGRLISTLQVKNNKTVFLNLQPGIYIIIGKNNKNNLIFREQIIIEND
jgi:acetyl esterase/lipase